MRPVPTRPPWPWLLLLAAAAPPGEAAGSSEGVTVGGELAVTSEYIYRGVAESDGNAAVQADLHAGTAGGTFAGVWGSSRNRNYAPYADDDIEVYAGHRFQLSSAWGATLSARSHYFVGGAQESNDDYQEIIGALTYLDRWTLSLTSIPNAVRYWYDLRLSRSPAWIADTSVQWLLTPGLFVTGSAGFYYSSGTGPGFYSQFDYTYGSVGLAFEHRHWRVDFGYFLAQARAAQLFPYPIANDRFAGTLLWRF
jgi:uncharacterized protein (TIGR02001 family)